MPSRSWLLYFANAHQTKYVLKAEAKIRNLFACL